MIKFNRVRASNPGKKGRKGRKGRKSARNPSFGRKSRKNPSFGGGSKLDVVPALVGAAGAIAVSAFADSTKAFATLRASSPQVAAVLPAGVTFAAGWALAKYGKQPMMKAVGKNLQIFGLFGGVNALAGNAIRKAVLPKDTAPALPDEPVKGLYFQRDNINHMSGSYFDRSEIGGTLSTF